MDVQLGNNSIKPLDPVTLKFTKVKCLLFTTSVFNQVVKNVPKLPGCRPVHLFQKECTSKTPHIQSFFYTVWYETPTIMLPTTSKSTYPISEPISINASLFWAQNLLQ